MMIENWVDKNFQKLVEIRRWLHQHPEVGFNEYETSQYCQNFMKDLGCTIYQTEPMKTGLYCDYGNGNGSTLAIRCDLDALPIHEVNSFDYCSLNPGVSHRK